MSFVLVVI